MSDTVNMIDKAGNTVPVPADRVGEAARQGLRVETPDEASTRVTEGVERERYSGPAATVLAGAAGLARGATLGASDLLIGAIGGGETLHKLQQYNPTTSTLTNIAGALVPAIATGGASLAEEGAGLLARSPAAMVSRLGAGVAERAGGGVYGAVKAGVAEGGLYGAGNAVSELAMSNDPLTAEHIASTLSSNVLLGAGLGGLAGGAFKTAERALARANGAITDAAAARSAIAGVPEDLAGLDVKALREAAATERTALKTQAEAERTALEEARVPQRKQLADEIKSLHDAMANEAPISKAVQGADVGAIEGVKDIRVQLAKSYGSIRTAFDSPLSVARDPGSLIRPLEMRQTALEALQTKVPELETALAGDARGAALRHVDDALAETKAQLGRIRELKAPATSEKLTDLTSGTSPRLKAIEAAQEAHAAKPPDKGLVQKGAEGAAFAGGTALAHVIPGVGLAAPFVGKGASEMVGRLFEHLAGGGTAVAKKASEATKAFLDVANKIAPTAPPVASKVLGAVRFATQRTEPTGKEKLSELFHARAGELRGQTAFAPDGSVQMRPEARAELSKRLDPIAQVNPLLADKIESVQVRKTEYLSSTMPRKPDVGGLQIGPDNWTPPELEIRAWARRVRAAEDPAGVEQRLVEGTITPEDAQTYRAVYPERFKAMQQAIFEQAPLLSKTLPLRRKIALSIFTGVPLIPALQPNVLAVLQGNFASEPGSAGGTQAPKPMPSFGAFGSVKSMDKPTPAQSRQLAAQGGRP